MTIAAGATRAQSVVAALAGALVVVAGAVAVAACKRATKGTGATSASDGGKDDAGALRLRACEAGDSAACFASGLDALYARDPATARRAYTAACSHGDLFDGGTAACLADITRALDALTSAHDDCIAHTLGGCRREGELLIALRVDAPFAEECKLRGLLSADAGVAACVVTMHETAYCEGKAMELLVTNPPPDRDYCEKHGYFVAGNPPPSNEAERPTIAGPPTIESITPDLSRTMVQEALDKALPDFVACTEGAAPFQTFDPMRVVFGIDPFGEVPLARFLGWPTGDTRVFACVLKVVRAMRFPPGPRNGTVDVAITPKNVLRTK